MCWPSPGTRRPKWMSASTATPASLSSRLRSSSESAQPGELAGLGDIGPRVERAAGRLAGHAGHRVEQAHDQVAALEERRAHRRGGILRPVDRFDRRPLADLRGAGIGVGDPAREHRRQRAVGDVADAPAGHRPGLRRAIGNDRALEHARQRRERRRIRRRRAGASRSRRRRPRSADAGAGSRRSLPGRRA